MGDASFSVATTPTKGGSHRRNPSTDAELLAGLLNGVVPPLLPLLPPDALDTSGLSSSGDEAPSPRRGRSRNSEDDRRRRSRMDPLALAGSEHRERDSTPEARGQEKE